MVAKKKVKKVKETKKSKIKWDLANFNFLNPQNKSQLILKNILVFIGLLIFSIIGGNISTNVIFVNFFILLAIVSVGFILGLFITLMVLILLKRRNK